MTTTEQITTVDRLARATWSHIIEPGDEWAGQLIAQLGPLAALDRVISPTAEHHPVMGGYHQRVHQVDVDHSLAILDDLGGSLICPGDPCWPAGLDDLGAAAPPVLWARGTLPSPRCGLVTITGARACTTYGQRIAADLAAQLASTGHGVLSGGGYGIDVAAHRAALASEGHTVAVLASGVDRLYPAGNADLLARIAQIGAILSEVPPYAVPLEKPIPRPQPRPRSVGPRHRHCRDC